MKIQSVTLHVGLHFFHFNLICPMTTFRKEKNDLFDPIPGVVGVCVMTAFCFHGALCSISFNLICNMNTFRKIYTVGL